MNLYKYVLLLCLVFVFACEKEIKKPVDPTPEEVEEPTEEESIRMRIADYYKKYSLWTDDINDLDEKEQLALAKRYTSNQSILTALKNMTPTYSFRPYTTMNVRVGTRYDRYSFLDESDAEGNVSYADGIRMDANEGYGLYFYWGLVTEGTENWARPVIYFVEGGSPAQQSGVRRGSVVLGINDIEDTKVATVYRGGKYEIADTDMAKAERIQEAWYAGMDAATLALKIRTEEEPVVDHNLTHAASYDIKPIITDSVYTYPEKNIGYFAYSSFEETGSRGSGPQNRRDLDKVFQSFEEANIKDLVLDLRYNTGGYVLAAEYLANKMIHAAGDKQLMYTYHVNNYLKNHREYGPMFADVRFEKNSQLELENVYVLVTEQTASAAELLISVIKPYLNVTIIAETDRTYGKPVGFFDQKISGSEAILWVTSFKTINADGYTDYWDGMKVDINGVRDDIFVDFGDTREEMLAKALDLAGISGTTNSARASSRRSTIGSSSVKMGMINPVRERNMLKKQH